VACLLAFSAIRNNDKVGLILFSDQVELFIPPKKGRSHTLRLIREILFFEPQGRGTLPSLALDYLNHVVTRRSVVFFISDFQAEDFSRALTITGRRHDFIAVRIDDEREEVLPDVGIITLEDAETGEQIEINTGDRRTRTRFSEAARALRAEVSQTLRRNNIDAISLRTGDDYLPALRAFFKQREAANGASLGNGDPGAFNLAGSAAGSLDCARDDDLRAGISRHHRTARVFHSQALDDFLRRGGNPPAHWPRRPG
jgi:uncharacterized protein (DUF58 family)